MKIKKPPLGLIPEYIWKEQVKKWVDSNGGITLSDFIGFRIARIEAIENAITRYEKAEEEIPDDWFVEGLKLIITIDESKKFNIK